MTLKEVGINGSERESDRNYEGNQGEGIGKIKTCNLDLESESGSRS